MYRILIIWAFASVFSSAETIVVSQTGEDGAVKTIAEASDLAQPGDVVLVRPGVYRERVTPPRGGKKGQPITYRAEKLGKVFIRGSELWQPEWRAEGGGIFSAKPDASLFNDDVYIDQANPFEVELASTPEGRQGKPESERFGVGDPELIYTCGQIIIDSFPWKQRPFLKEVQTRPGTWAYDRTGGRVYINFGKAKPTDHEIEITSRRRIFAPHIRGLGYITIEGFVMEHCGNQYPTNFWDTPKWAQAGALGLRGGHHWVIRHNLIRYANADAIDMGRNGGDNETDPKSIPGAPRATDNLIENNYIIENGAGGICGSTSERLVVRGNLIMRNNTQGFTGQKRYEHAGIKAHGIYNAVIEGNYVAENQLADGIWLDNQFSGTRVSRNVIVNNGSRGIFLEMSDYQWDAVLIDHNIAIGNGIQFYAHDASGSTVMHNLFANSPADGKYGQGAYIYQVGARTKTGFHSLYHNLFINHKSMLDINYPKHRGGPQRSDFNVYDAEPDERAFVINRASDVPSPWKPAEFYELIKVDLGSDSPEAIRDGRKVALTLAEWRSFWRKHGQNNDLGSVCQKGITVAYDSNKREVIINLPFSISGVGLHRNKEKLTRDFQGSPYREGKPPLPGPFQSLKVGENRFKVWSGLPILEAGELPK